MARRIALYNEKGGVGKTTTCVSAAVTLADKGFKVAICDADIQGHSCLSCGVSPEEAEKTLYDVLIGEADIREIIKKSEFGVDLIPPHRNLSLLESIIALNPDEEAFQEPANILRNQLIKIDDMYDYIFIDLPPSYGFMTINGLCASTDVIATMQAEYLSTVGILNLLKTMEEVWQNGNDVKIFGILATMVNAGTNLSSIIIQEGRKFALDNNIRMFETVIPRSTKVAEAPMYGIPSVRYQPDNKAIQEYINFVEEAFGNGR